MREMKDSGVEWIGEIPVDWTISKVGVFYDITLGKMLQPRPNANDTLEEYLCAANVGNNKLTLTNIKKMWFSDEEKETYRLHKGDLLVVEGGDIASSAILDYEPENLFFQNALHRVTPKNSTNSFLRYWLIAAKATGYFDIICNKATIAHFTKAKFTALPFVPLDISAQNRISLFLDAKARGIDALIANNEAQIEQLRQYKQSLITETVTHGFDPEAPMKDSGVEWIGEIPESWTISRIKDKFSLRNERNYEPLEDVNLISLYTDKGVVQHSDLTETTGNRAVTADGYKKVYRNDIVVNIILCWMGAVGMSNYDGVTSPAYDVYQPKAGTLSRYYHYLFRTARFSGECFRYGRGIMLMRWRTYSDEFTAIKIPVPPPEVQRKIVKFLDEKCGEIDALISLKRDKIEKLKQYRQSLIYEYVTGKKAVLEQ